MQKTIEEGLWRIIHNARLLDVSVNAEGRNVMIVEVSGTTIKVESSVDLSSQGWRNYSIGKIGFLSNEENVSAPVFIPYVDQSLRRAPELDVPRAVKRGIGWRCDQKPSGFLAPVGLIPGIGGDYELDCTEPVTINIPEELTRLAREHQLTPVELLRGFIADLCNLESTMAKPRADRYTSNGSDERMLAQDWLDRAYGMSRIDITAALAAEAHRDETVEELGYALDDFVAAGGSADELVDAVQGLVSRKQAEQKISPQNQTDESEGGE